MEKQLGVPIIWLDLPLEKLCAISTIPANVYSLPIITGQVDYIYANVIWQTNVKVS